MLDLIDEVLQETNFRVDHVPQGHVTWGIENVCKAARESTCRWGGEINKE